MIGCFNFKLFFFSGVRQRVLLMVALEVVRLSQCLVMRRYKESTYLLPVKYLPSYIMEHMVKGWACGSVFTRFTVDSCLTF